MTPEINDDLQLDDLEIWGFPEYYVSYSTCKFCTIVHQHDIHAARPSQNRNETLALQCIQLCSLESVSFLSILLLQTHWLNVYCHIRMWGSWHNWQCHSQPKHPSQMPVNCQSKNSPFCIRLNTNILHSIMSHETSYWQTYVTEAGQCLIQNPYWIFSVSWSCCVHVLKRRTMKASMWIQRIMDVINWTEIKQCMRTHNYIQAPVLNSTFLQALQFTKCQTMKYALNNICQQDIFKSSDLDSIAQAILSPVRCTLVSKKADSKWKEVGVGLD